MNLYQCIWCYAQRELSDEDLSVLEKVKRKPACNKCGSKLLKVVRK